MTAATATEANPDNSLASAVDALKGANVSFTEALAKVAADTGTPRRKARAALIAAGWTPDVKRP